MRTTSLLNVGPAAGGAGRAARWRALTNASRRAEARRMRRIGGFYRGYVIPSVARDLGGWAVRSSYRPCPQVPRYARNDSYSVLIAEARWMRPASRAGASPA